MTGILRVCIAATSLLFFSAAWSGAVEEKPMPARPVLHFSFSEPPENNIIADSGTRNNQGFNHGAEWIPNGRANGAMRFDGKSSWIQTPNGHIMQKNHFTLAAWLRPAQDLRGAQRCVIISRERHGKNAGFDFAWHDGRLGLYFRLEPFLEARCTAADANLTMAADEWRFVATTYDGEKARVFVDDELLTTIPIAVEFSDSNLKDLFFGAQAPGDQGFWHGDIDELMIYDRALTTEEIRAIAQTPP